MEEQQSKLKDNQDKLDKLKEELSNFEDTVSLLHKLKMYF